MNVYISGGCKNGKSFYAQQLAQQMARDKSLPLYYVATMMPVDGEDRQRIIRHQKEREGWGFETIEQPTNICQILEITKGHGVYLMDSVTALLSNEMFPPYQEGIQWEADRDAGERVKGDLIRLAKEGGNIVFVSDFIYGDGYRGKDLTDQYRKALGHIDRAVASVCQRVIEVTFGNIIEYKEQK